MIQKTKWSKEHVIEGIKRVCQNPEMIKNARNLNAYEFGVYRGRSCQLIENVFYGYQFPINKLLGLDSFAGLPNEKEGIEKFYLFQPGMFSDVHYTYPVENCNYIKCWFNELTSEDVKKYNMKPAAFLHHDGDLYISCLQAYTFMFENNLIIPGTVVGYDEFRSTKNLDKGGESKAHFEIADKYKVEFKEFFRNIYNDSQSGEECWQSAFEVISIGNKSEYGLLDAK